MSELWEITVAQAAAAIRDRKCSPVELLESLFRRCADVEPRVQAWETLDPEGATAVAKECEREASSADWRGLLHGVPFGVKDIYFTAGLRTTASFAPHGNFVPVFDATAVTRLRRAGAIVMGKTVTTQFALTDPPKTRNPWNLERTPGGSSSGSGAAVAARMAPFALGSQTVGSVLRPAAYNGVVGFKPSYGRVSRNGIFPVAWSLDHPGWLCRSVEDAALILDHLAGSDPRDPASAQPPLENTHGALADRVPPRCGLLLDFQDRAKPEVRTHVEHVARRLASAGADVREVRLPDGCMDLMLAVQQVILLAEVAAVHAQQLERHREHYRPILRSNVEVGQLIPGHAYVQAQRLRRRLRAQVLGTLRDVDVFLSPTASNEAPDPSTTGDRTLQAPWSLLGFPAISLPSGLSVGGLPLAVQLGANRWEETKLLRAAAWCEAVLGSLPTPPL